MTTTTKEEKEHLLTQEEFNKLLFDLGEEKAKSGKIVIQQLLKEAAKGRYSCAFHNWPSHLKQEAYNLLGVQPVQMYRKIKK